LVNQDVTGARVITAFHERRVLPLMWWARQLDEMVLNIPLEGTMLMMEELDHEEIKKRIKSVLGNVSFDATLNLHQPMCPDDGFIEMVSAPPPFSLGIFVFPFHRLTQGSGGRKGISTWSLISTHPFSRVRPRRRGTRLTPAKRKEECKKHRRMQQEAGEEEETSEDDDDEGAHPYDWLDSMAEEGEQLEGAVSLD
jgi:hypothetical protein